MFVNTDPPAPAPLADSLGRAAGADRPERARRRSASGLGASLEANWKVAVENYLECYHCPVAHKAFSALVDVDPDSYRLEAADGLFSQYGRAPNGPDDGTATQPASSTSSGRR